MSLVFGALTMGLLLALLSLGMLISFRMIRFTDITVDGSITLGAAVAAVMIARGVNPWLATLCSLGAGAIAGTLTGLLHTRFKIPELLAGILMMTALYSINLRIMGRSNIPLLDVATVSDGFGGGLRLVTGDASKVNLLGWLVPISDLATLSSSLAICCAMGILLRGFLLTHLGTGLRVSGSNPQMARAQGVNNNAMIVFGLALSNGLVALSGALLAQYQGFADIQMGIGMMVWGLASIIIGEALVGKTTVGLAIGGTVLGTILFRMMIAIALRWGLNPNDLKLVTAAFVFIALVAPNAASPLRKALAKGIGHA